MTKSNNARLDPAAAGVHRGKGKRAMGRSMARREPRQGRVVHQPSSRRLWRRRLSQERSRSANGSSISPTRFCAKGLED